MGSVPESGGSGSDLRRRQTSIYLSTCASAAAALSSSSEYSSSSHSLWSAERGSFSVTGIDIFERSFPMFLHNCKSGGIRGIYKAVSLRFKVPLGRGRACNLATFFLDPI